ncbi:hypothetical protein evm_015020 [Chilo suppressalis]|nr:hypothetical protein evm_015020 [Chilo suppressalis]
MVFRDAMIVTTLDTFTSLLSGVTIFGILGNLAHELNQDVSQVVGSGGTGLAFISYPDAIAKTFMPQLFAVLFFLMMSVLGVGSAVALMSTINTVMMDAFPRVRTVYMSALCCTIGFCIGLIYVTPVCSVINTVILDAFLRVRTVYMSALCCTIGFCIGLIYVTPACSVINTVMMDAFLRVRAVYMSALRCTIGFVIGLIYVTPI